MPQPSTSRGVLAILRMGDGNCVHHLNPVADAIAPRELRVVRPLPRPRHLAQRAAYTEIRNSAALLRTVRTLATAFRLARDPSVTHIISFNALPYGLIALAVGRSAGKQVHIGLVGTDAHRLRHRWYGRLLDRLVRLADVVTVPGPAMLGDLVDRGYQASRVSVLPHGVDLDTFDFGSAERDIDVLFAGSLIETKRVDAIIDAVSLVARSRPGIRMVVVGDGPMRADLERRSFERGLAETVEFVGHQVSMAEWYHRARTIAVASKWEGFPFVLVEGMASGVIPVTVAAGSIGDHIEDGVDGVLARSGAPEDVAEGLLRILDDEQLESGIRARLESRRSSLGYDAVVAFWAAHLDD